MTAPHVGLVAEAGPEAIIPLTDKSRGIPLLMRAAEILGLREKSQTFSTASQTSGGSQSLTEFSRSDTQTLREITRTGQDTQSYSVREAGQYVSRYSDAHSEHTHSDSGVAGSGPITVNVTASTQQEQDLAARIAQAVREALAGILEERERLSYGTV